MENVINHIDEDLRWLNLIRDTEFESAIQNLSGLQINNVLELGSGTGYILGKLKKIYPSIVGLEVEGSSYSRLDHGIKIYDGVNIPIIGDLKYDLIISFHVLEHAQNLDGLLSSCFDALTEDGIMIHVLPSPAWRILTTLFWPLGGLAHILRRLSSKVDKTIGSSSETGSKVRWRWLLSRAIPRAHGERGGPITEAYYFSRKFWSDFFAASGFKVIDVTQSHIVYWGNDFIRQGLGLQTRKSLSQIIGSSSNIYILKKQTISKFE